MFIFHNVTITFPANFTQCTTRGSFVTHWQETAYNMFTFCCLFLLPLIIMITCYTRIFIQISRHMAKKSCKKPDCAVWLLLFTLPGYALEPPLFPSAASSDEPDLRCSKNNIPKARMRTLKMSLVIVICFVVCWTPYYLLGLWYWFFPDDLEGKVSHSLTHILFIFGLVNACLDPIIYGLFTIRFRRGLRSCYSRATATPDAESKVAAGGSLTSVSALRVHVKGTEHGLKVSTSGTFEAKSSDSRCPTVFRQDAAGHSCRALPSESAT